MVKAMNSRESSVALDIFNDAFEEKKKVPKTGVFPALKMSPAAKASCTR
jgi:hypothetical protein